MKKFNLRMMTEGAVMIALAFVLSNIKIYKMPQGGSVTLGGYVPLFVFALRWGTVPGMIVGLLYGCLDFIVDPYVLTPIQALLDYPIAYMTLGLAGLGKSDKTDNGEVNIRMIIGILIGGGMRLFAGLLSGVVFFAQGFIETGINPWIGSLIYNASYAVPNTILAIVIIFIIWRPLAKATSVSNI